MTTRRAKIFNFQCRACKAEGVAVFFDCELCEDCDREAKPIDLPDVDLAELGLDGE